ncbi:MAG: hypothetical protein HPZ91_01440 [Lentisphaeria bacterium]|nr:hypothetical protein [Lentisphaeria bacterium]
MEISNRKLFSRGMVAIGFAVAFSGIPGEVLAADQPETAAAVATAKTEDKELSAQEKALRRKKFAEQDARIAAARKMDFENGKKEFQAVIAELADPAHNYGTLGKERHRLFLKELEGIKLARGNELLGQARKAAADELYPNAIQLASEANEVSKPEKQADGSQADSPLAIEVDTFIDFCRTRQHALETRQAVGVKNSYPQYEANAAKIKRLLAEARVFYKTQRYEDAISRVEEVYLLDPFQRDAIQLMNDIYKKIYTAGMHRREADIAGMLASDMWQWVEPVFPMSIQPGLKQGERKEPAGQGTLAKMERIVFPRIEFEDMNVKSVLSYLNDRSKIYDPDKEGVSITAGFDNQTADRLGKVTMSLARIPMSEVIRYVCQNTGLKYRVDPSGVIVGPNVDEMQIQYFQVRGDLISSITGDDSAEAAQGGAAMGGEPPPEQQAAPTGVTGQGGEASKTFLDRSAVRKPSVTAMALMRYFEERGVPFGEGSSISYDKRASKLIVRNTIENLRRLDELIRQLDGIQTPLVMVEIKGIEISETDMQELGFDWSMDLISRNMTMDELGNISLKDGAKSGWAFGQGGSRLSNTRGSTANDALWGIDTTVINKLNIFPAIFGKQSIFGSDVPFNLYLTINALSQNSRTETLSAPKVMTTSGNKASVQMVKSYWFPTDWEEYEIDDDDNGVTITIPTPEFEEFDDIGISFDVTPVVNPDNYTITLDVNPVVRNFIGKDEYPIVVTGEITRYVNATDENGVAIPGTQVIQRTEESMTFNVWMPIISSRRLRVNVTVYDGETIVLGGMIDSAVNKRTDKWPILGDLPFIGRLFTSQAEDTVRNNLLLFVTTRLVNNDGIPIRRGQRNGAPDFHR